MFIYIKWKVMFLKYTNLVAWFCARRCHVPRQLGLHGTGVTQGSPGKWTGRDVPE